jgi:hypothetical protein
MQLGDELVREAHGHQQPHNLECCDHRKDSGNPQRRRSSAARANRGRPVEDRHAERADSRIPILRSVTADTMCRMLNPPVYDLAVTEAISNVLAQTDYPGLSGGELVAVLKHAKVFEFEDGPNKSLSHVDDR